MGLLSTEQGEGGAPLGALGKARPTGYASVLSSPISSTCLGQALNLGTRTAVRAAQCSVRLNAEKGIFTLMMMIAIKVRLFGTGPQKGVMSVRDGLDATK